MNRVSSNTGGGGCMRDQRIFKTSLWRRRMQSNGLLEGPHGGEARFLKKSVCEGERKNGVSSSSRGNGKPCFYLWPAKPSFVWPFFSSSQREGKIGQVNLVTLEISDARPTQQWDRYTRQV